MSRRIGECRRPSQKVKDKDGEYAGGQDAFVAASSSGSVGRGFVIARKGKPLVRVVPLNRAHSATPKRAVKRFGFMEGEFEGE